MNLSCFSAIVAADFEFEFGGRNGNLPRPVCMVAKELRTGEIWRLWRDEFGSEPPFPSAPTRYLLVSRPPPNSAVSWPWAGLCRRGFSI